MSGKFLGSYGNEAQWSLPVEKQTNGDGSQKIGTINMENYKVRKCINDLDELIDISIPCKEQTIPSSHVLTITKSS